MRVSGKAACLSPGRAACGCCQRVCPRAAIHIMGTMTQGVCRLRESGRRPEEKENCLG